ncbi:diacylglycerol O-acyltransferase 1 [Entomophthora muscae]|uniref:Diacylglycerol O-acyltransferase 1 n=1 Tax=Entomophthora muscae TaxID=34485 RepID=A0ACC2T2V6_9FUNG|nr:diacylglycerol O-acyltransferase 1 [Entomophthora muscae]
MGCGYKLGDDERRKRMENQELRNVSVLKKGKATSLLDYARAFMLNTKCLPRVEFAPLNVPFERRKQMLCLIFYNTLTLQSLVIFWLVVYHKLWLILLVYLTFWYFDRGYENGGWDVKWIKRLAVWREAAAYFPINMVREQELDPTKQYLFGYHPHGIIANGAVLGFVTDALGVSNIFPGIKIRMITINAIFHVPVYRELVNLFGFCSATKKSINNLFKQGNSCLIVVGGAEESLLAAPGTANLVINKRQGFIAVAIKNGANLVPVYAFGENDSFDIVIPEPGSLVHKAQMAMKKALGFTVPLYHGRNIFMYNYGMLPKRNPITIVVGSPIPVERDPEPSPEKVAQVHQQYLDALQDLYDRNKAKYSNHGVIPDLKFV